MTTVTQNQNFRREKEIGDLWEQFYSPIVCCGSPGQVLPSLSLESKSCLLSLRGLVHTSDRTVLWWMCILPHNEKWNVWWLWKPRGLSLPMVRRPQEGGCTRMGSGADWLFWHVEWGMQTIARALLYERVSSSVLSEPKMWTGWKMYIFYN